MSGTHPPRIPLLSFFRAGRPGHATRLARLLAGLALAGLLTACAGLTERLRSLSGPGGATLAVQSGPAGAQEGLPSVENGEAARPSERDGRLDSLRQQAASGAPDGALSLAQAWQRAQLHDARYLAALSEYAASQNERAVGRAALLPQVQASAYRGRVRGSRRLPDFLGRMSESELGYDSTSAALQLQQPVFDRASYAEYRRGAAQAAAGEAQLAVARQEAALRLASAYYQLVLASGRLDLQRGLTASLESRLATLEAMLRNYVASRTDVDETRAHLALARASLVAARDARRLAHRELALLLGREPGPLADTLEGLRPQPPRPARLGAWLDTARSASPHIWLAERRQQLARVGVEQAGAAFWPSATLVARLAHADSEDLDALSEKSNTFTVGLQVQMPLFAGGYHSADRARAAARRREAESLYQATLAQVQAEAIRQFKQVEGGVARVAALEQAERSAGFSLEAMSKSFEHGLAANLDVLKAQDAVYQARQQLLEARVQWRMAGLRLAAVSGQPLPFEENTVALAAKP